MGEARHHRIGLGFGPFDQRGLQLAHRRIDAIDRGAHPQPQIGRDLVVTGTAGVELAGGGADFLVEQALDEGVHVLIRRAGGGTVGEPLGNAVEPVEQLGLFFRRQHPDAAQRVDPRFARRDILGPEAVIHREAAVQRVKRFSGTEREAAAPHLVGGR